MKLSAEREDLLHPLQQVIGAVERKQTQPILGNVLIEANQDGLVFTATDSEIELRAMVSVHADVNGAVTVPARKLLDICRSLSDNSRVDLELSASKLKLKSGRSRFTLATLPADEFPKVGEITEGQELQLKENDLNEAIHNTAFSMAQQDVRFYLNGMLLEIGMNKLCCVATDGHRLAYSETSTDLSPDEPVRAIIPRKSVNELARLLGKEEHPVTVFISKNHLQVTLPGVRVTTKLIEGRFPDYNRVIPIDGDKKLQVDRELLRQSLGRAAILSNEKYRGVRLALSPKVLTISSNNPEQEEAIDDMEVDYSGGDVEIGFNVSYVLDALNIVETEEVCLFLKDGNSSMLLTPSGETGNKYVIMPMRL